jgi:hypothetical protein
LKEGVLIIFASDPDSAQRLLKFCEIDPKQRGQHGEPVFVRFDAKEPPFVRGADVSTTDLHCNNAIICALLSEFGSRLPSLFGLKCDLRTPNENCHTTGTIMQGRARRRSFAVNLTHLELKRGRAERTRVARLLIPVGGDSRLMNRQSRPDYSHRSFIDQ